MSQAELDRRLVALASLGDPLRRDLTAASPAATVASGGTRRPSGSDLQSTGRLSPGQAGGRGTPGTRFERLTGRSGPVRGERPSCISGRPRPSRSPCPPGTTRSLPSSLLVPSRRSFGPSRDRIGPGSPRPWRGGRRRERRSSQRTGPPAPCGSCWPTGDTSPTTAKADQVTQLPVRETGPGHRELVCHANLAFMEGLLEGHPHGGVQAVLDPRPEGCCVTLV